jgi:hypothetical protein
LYAKHSLDVLYQALSQHDLSGSCSIFRNHLFKVSQAFPFQANFVFFKDPPNQAYPLVRSFKAFLLIDVLFFVVCLLCVCLCAMIDALRVNAIREVLSS